MASPAGLVSRMSVLLGVLADTSPLDRRVAWGAWSIRAAPARWGPGRRLSERADRQRPVDEQVRVARVRAANGDRVGTRLERRRQERAGRKAGLDRDARARGIGER